MPTFGIHSKLFTVQENFAALQQKNSYMRTEKPVMLQLRQNTFMSITVILGPFRGPSDERCNSDPPEKSADRQMFANFLRILASLT